jgi:ATP-dependent protease HslVU (ClpYQ) peptidase subunit
MTTIAVKGSVMASDSCWAFDDTPISKQSKIYRTEHGLLIGSAGGFDDRDFIMTMQKVKKSAELPKLSEFGACFHEQSELEALILFPNREVWLFCKDKATSCSLNHLRGTPYAAIGSGAKQALTAMRMGASAYKAVEIACEMDINSRTPVFFEQLRLKTRKKRINTVKKRLSRN